MYGKKRVDLTPCTEYSTEYSEPREKLNTVIPRLADTYGGHRSETHLSPQSPQNQKCIYCTLYLVYLSGDYYVATVRNEYCTESSPHTDLLPSNVHTHKLYS